MTESKKEEKPKFKDVHEVLHFIQKTLNVPKANENKFGGYKYRSCEDIVEAVKKIMPEQTTLKLADDIIMIGNRYYLKSTASLCFAGQCESVTGFAREAETRKGFGEDQLTGAASSYARKYALNGLFMIDDTKDSDATSDHGKPDKTAVSGDVKQKSQKPELTPTQAKIAGWAKEIKSCTDYQSVLETARKINADSKDLSLDQMNWINNQINEAQDKFNPMGA